MAISILGSASSSTPAAAAAAVDDDDIANADSSRRRCRGGTAPFEVVLEAVLEGTGDEDADGSNGTYCPAVPVSGVVAPAWADLNDQPVRTSRRMQNPSHANSASGLFWTRVHGSGRGGEEEK